MKIFGERKNCIISKQELLEEEKQNCVGKERGGVVCSKPPRELIEFLPKASPYQMSSRSFAADGGGVVCSKPPRELIEFLPKASPYQMSSRSFAADGDPGDRVEIDEPIAQVETDKVTIDVASPEAGVIQKFVAKEGDTVTPGTKVAVISKSASSDTHVAPSEEKASKDAPQPSPPAKEKMEKEMLKAEAPIKEKPKASSPAPPKTSASEPLLPPKERERRVPMPRLRKRVAMRLKDSQNTFAMLTTFNEVDMTNLMKLRSEYKDAFLEKHGVKLGLMSGFVKAAVSGLQNQPIINAVIDGDDIIYRDYIDISIAVGTPKGLVVPVVRNADQMNFAEIEKEINNLAKKANNGTISIDEMAGGTFTISNGGVYGSLLSTPIINPPQSAILGMHSIVSRPMMADGNIVPRPMMYVALTYDHRLIDGREAVLFLRRIKDVVEDPRRLLLDL
ncbi:Dihydrolipoyllysine-residue succinyltransferase component of 2-oxoglutarate dehydrogenase complex 1,mitochondrial [Cocos nucifera]|uniref:dihydrolipoyllysine-residue succinyltransferase n=1 Tax=Cocos nucifera TaxID=13894 RepID=A0A8K0IXA2_COCNU|nr:Dihydrolipoyllysine-residue succinyltransferase component of 2-oxoglutarate dehydrogenase complex 1,mitochondrial [Cocos nucifera]